MATYNAGLARGDIANVDERVGPVVNALASQDVDLLCVQELWQDWDALVAATPHLPNVVHSAPLADCAPAACSPFEMGPMLTCGAEQCDGLVGGGLLTCGLDLCSDEVGALSPGCTSCIIGAAAGGLEGMEADCLGDPSQGGEQYLYDCHFDTGILTRAEILSSESRRIDSTTVTAAVDYAQIATGAGSVDVFCTHLASGMPFEYGGAHGSWMGEQARQIEQVLAFVAEKNDGTRPVLLLGDLNNGPAIAAAGIDPEWPEHYQQWEAAGFDDPYVDQADVACTLCSDNSFRGDGSSSRLIDHVLVKNAPSTLSCERFMTESTSIDVQGESVQSHYSDHYGLVCEMPSWCSG